VKLRSITTRHAGPLRARDISELAVLLRFGDLVVAIAAQQVARIALADDGVPAAGATPSVQIDGAVLPAWDLGKLLGLSVPPTAWLVMMTGDEPGAPRIALGTGPCLAIGAHGQVAPLPPGVVSAPPGAVAGVFVTDAALRERGLGELGVRIDPMRLIGTPAASARRGDR
jgi:hypothetical protein